MGTNVDHLKSIDAPDSDSSISDTEADQCKISATDDKSYAKVNEHIILGNKGARVMTETLFSREIEAVLGGIRVKVIELVHIDCTSAVFSQMIKHIASQNTDPKNQQLDSFVLNCLTGMTTPMEDEATSKLLNICKQPKVF